MVLLIVGLILFIGLVIAHEWGHFTVAKRNGVEVEEFGIFFPPKIWSRKTKGGWDFSINLVPIGGFVRLKGEKDADTEPGTYGAATLWVKTKILLAGVGMNLLVAFVLLTALGWMGMPQIVDNQFTIRSDTKTIKQEVLAGEVTTDSPAEKAGIQRGDKLLGYANSAKLEGAASDFSDLKSFETASNLPKVTEKFAGQAMTIGYERDGVRKMVTAKLLSKQEVEKSKKTDSPKGYLGIAPTEYAMTRSTWSAPVTAVGLIGQFTEMTFKGLGAAIAGVFQGDSQKAQEQVSGPVGVFVLLRDGSILGVQFMLAVIALVSLSLAIMNVLPIPALDGGKLFVTLVSRAFGQKSVSERVENWVYGSGFVFLILLIVLITIVDIKRFF